MIQLGSDTLVDWLERVGPVAIGALGLLGGFWAWLIERRNKKREELRFEVEANRLAKNLDEYQSLLDTVKMELESVKNDPARIVVPHLEKQIEKLEHEKARLELELEAVKRSLSNLQNGLEKVYQESKRSITDIPGVRDEEDVYRKQISILTGYLDDIRSSIVEAKSVSVKFQEHYYDSLSKSGEIDAAINRLKNQRDLAGGSLAHFKATGYKQERLAEQLKAHREAKARAEARAQAEAKAKNAHLQKRSFDE